MSVTIDDIRAAEVRIAGHVHRTPVHTSRTLDAAAGCEVFCKCENLQRAGAFKFRGAINAMNLLDDAARARGVLTWSSGNHAQAVALASRMLGIDAVIVMPTDAPRVKLAATRGYLEGTGGEVVLYERKKTTREELGSRIAGERGLTIVPPYDHPDVIAGQGTAAFELFEEVGPLDVLLTPCGGGGLLSGSAVVAAAYPPRSGGSHCRVFGVEPESADDAARSFRARELHTVLNPDTIADGARTPSLGAHTFPLVCEHVHDMVTVSEIEIIAALRLIWERMKLVVEPTGALGVAGLLRLAREERLDARRAGVILSGGNVDLDVLGAILARQ